MKWNVAKKFQKCEKHIILYNKLWVSIDELKLDIIRKIHDQSTIKHSNIKRMYKFVKRLYYWLEMRNLINRYVRNYHVCKQSKASWDRYSELLNSVSISNKFWTNITMNFVIELFRSKEFNAILIIVDKLTKMRHYIFCTIEKENTFVNVNTRWNSTCHMLIKACHLFISKRTIRVK